MSNWPVIVHKSSSNQDIVRELLKRKVKLRFSESIVPNTVIFPLSGVAFMILPTSRTTLDQTTLYENIDRFIHVHGHCYILLKASLHGEKEQQFLNTLQQRYLSTSLTVLPVHNTSDIMQAIFCIAKLLCKPACDIINKRFSNLAEQLLNESIDEFLKQFGLSNHHVTKDGLGSLSKIAAASKDDLLDCSLDFETTKRILSYFNSKV